jgi:hypothetical protein
MGQDLEQERTEVTERAVVLNTDLRFEIRTCSGVKVYIVRA